ncbi:MAG: Hsp70 family protein [Planctomycetota bacterium]|nr:Hsp70 family protein [Planctomycetota bacterium]
MLGIDLGASHGRVAVFGATGPRVLEDRDGASAVPMAVAVDGEGKPVTGQAARKILAERPGAGAEGFLADLGKEKTYAFGGRAWTPAECLALYLQHLARLAEAALGAPPGPAVIAVPAYFHDGQRQAVKDAALRAGLEFKLLLNEPTAVALAWCFEHPKDRRLVMVLELDARAFDVTLLDMLPERFEVLAADGGKGLGAAELRDGGRVAAALDAPLHRALRQAGKQLKDIEEILLAGGSEHVEALEATLRDRHRRTCAKPSRPEEAVALGAAVFARIAPDAAKLAEAPGAPIVQTKPGCLVLLALGLAALAASL